MGFLFLSREARAGFLIWDMGMTACLFPGRQRGATETMVGELFPSSKSQLQGGYMANGGPGQALEACMLLFSGKNGVTIRQDYGRTRSWDTDPISTV